MRSTWAVAALVSGLVGCGFYDSVPSPSNPIVPNVGLPDAGLPNLPDGGYALPDGGFGLPDGGFQLPDGGFQLPDGGFSLPDGGFGQEWACPPSTCVQEIFAVEQGSPRDLAVQGGYVYWSNPLGAATLVRKYRSAGERGVLYTGPLEAALQVDEGQSFFVIPEDGAQSLVELDHPGGSSRALLARWPVQTLAPGALAQNSTAVFARTANGLVQAAKDGSGTRVRLGSGLGVGLAANEAGAYVWYSPSNELLRVPSSLSEDALAWVATPPPQLRVEALHVEGEFLYAALVSVGALAGECTSGATLTRVPTAGGSLRDISSSPGCVVDLATDAQHLYWLASVRGQGALLLRVPLGGGPAWQLAQLQSEGASLAVDFSHVYWTEPGLGRVMRMAKP